MLILFLVQSVSLVKDNICGLDFQKQRAQNKHFLLTLQSINNSNLRVYRGQMKGNEGASFSPFHKFARKQCTPYFQ